jgi:hypothetical protein
MNRDEYIMPPDPNYGTLEINPDTLPNYNISFNNKGGEVGKLDFNGPEMKFIGNADESAQVLFDWLTEAFKLRLERERKEERARCIEQVKKSKVVTWFWYPKDHVIQANKISSIYEFQLKRTLEALENP